VTVTAPAGPLGRAGLLGSLYLAQGLPFGFFTLALPALLRESGASLTSIGLLGFLTLPWAAKFLWAPFLDGQGPRRRWLLALQLAAVGGAVLLAPLDPRANFPLLFAAAFAFNLVAASQDVITDGLAVRAVGARERGPANGLQVGAYRVGMILGGGALLGVFSVAGWTATCLAMAGLLALTVLPVLALREAPRLPAVPTPWRQSLLGWTARARQPALLGAAAVVFACRFGDQFVSGLFGPFLVDAGLGLADIALLKGTVGSATSLGGAVLGGAFVWWVGRRAALLATGLAQAASFGLYIAAAAGAGGIPLLWVATVAEGVLGTMATVALFALMMDAADPEHAGTDYTLLASVVVLVGSVAGLAGAACADAAGYLVAFVTGTVLALAGVAGVVMALDRRPLSGRAAAAWGRAGATR
jgi:MFS family permease